MSKIMQSQISKQRERASAIMKAPIPKGYEEVEDDDWEEDDFEEEEEKESKERDEFEANELVIPDSNTITVKVQNLEVTPIDVKFMKINKEIELRWLMMYYCESSRMKSKMMEFCNTKFMFNGARLQNGDTPLKLSMVDGDIIYVCSRKIHSGVLPSPDYQTLCIRAHKRRDTFVRVARNEPLLRSFKRNCSGNSNGKHDSTRYFHNRNELIDLHTVEMLRIEDGDVIYAFDFDDHKSSLSFVSGLPSTIRQPPTFKGNPDINKSGPSKNVLGTSGTRETLLPRKFPAYQQTTRPRPTPIVRYESSPSPSDVGTKRARY